MELSNYRWVLYLEAILFILLGIIAMAVPQLFTLGLKFLIGALFIVAGIIQIVHLFQYWDAPGFWGTLANGILNLVVGGVFFFFPIVGLLTLTILLIAYFFADGLTKIYYSLQLKSYEKWGWILFSGILSILLAALLLVGLPGTATWALGLLVGINMLFFGFALFGLASSVPKEKI